MNGLSLNTDAGQYDGVMAANAASSALKSPRQARVIPKVGLHELELAKVVGRGGFSIVREILRINLNAQTASSSTDDDASETSFAIDDDEDETSNIANKIIAEEQTTARDAISRKCNTTLNDHRYVIKLLRSDLPSNERTKGIVDLAVEARFLSTLPSHPNIISLRGTSTLDPLHSSGHYFVILDQLSATLERQLSLWRKDVKRFEGCCFKMVCRKKLKLRRLWALRVTAARDVASAVQFLHARGIVYRDIKPDNIGFDTSGYGSVGAGSASPTANIGIMDDPADPGVVKLFDFGLAKALHPDDEVTPSDPSYSKPQSQPLYNLTGNTGSLRYMAPEVTLGKPYNLTVDTYSFGILFWQICALATPYAGYTCKMHSDYVVGMGRRPKIDKTWPLAWERLMTDCWNGDLTARPSFDDIVEILSDEIEFLEDDSYTSGGDHVFGTHNNTRRKIDTMKGRKKKGGKLGKGKKNLDVDTRLGSQMVELNRKSSNGSTGEDMLVTNSNAEIV
mmetsp:Transcript_40151/g.46985  ORF Transcript_40151/g.46985 Transcript_40151/m.46985 type:complete len:507 (+) Transcript_40151:443-1963(+)|eukprot:CAMPEP_0194379532 /NCGR_PEP_ID=MMETSP0174-20130528/40096_1 /TAXON_ID=216777 /ORGANISM="Proboscia alata, Strain PI-D3" /LENGTH=506 /DNA_ID=CAMNT_0039162323 /DNA_START=386 /DNA_END=1906 /DNA_ORIENTATION=+